MSNLKVKLALGALAVLLIGIAAGYWFGGQRTSPARAADAAREHRKVLYWHDPMVPGAKFDKPGKSPFMDMQLVPVYAGDENAATVSVNAGVAQNLGIRLGKVEKSRVEAKLTAIGSVSYDEQLVEVVQARVEGYVTRLHVKSTLVHVKRGDALADILSPAWQEAQGEYLALLDAKSEQAVSIRDAARQRLVVLGMPDSVIHDLETQRKANPLVTVRAPIDGVVTELSVRDGAAFMTGAPLFRINGLSAVWVTAQIPEAQVSMIPAGATVTVSSTAWSGEQFSGRVVALLPEIDAQTRTFPVRIAVSNPQFKLSPGMFVSLDLTGTQPKEYLTVPSEAVIVTGERSVVIVDRDAGFDVVAVTVGPELDGKTAILTGLEEGQKIVLSGQFLIDSEASLRSAMTRLSASQEAKP